MLGFRYLKVPPTTVVVQYRDGKVVRQEAGAAFWYFAPTAVIAQVPVSSVDVPFAFIETTADFQDVTVNGVLTYRVVEPLQLASLLNYTTDARGRYVSDDPGKLDERLVQAAEAGARRWIAAQRLRDALVGSEQLVEAVTLALRQSATVTRLGVEVLEVAVASIRPDPEMAKALQSEARERLLQEADESIYARRNAGVAFERSIRENELETEIAVAAKNRQVRETEMQSEIAIEAQRAALVESRVENERKEAEARGAALRAVLEPAREVDWRTLLALLGTADGGTLIAGAFDSLAKNAEKIGELNVSPELLHSLMKPKR